MFQAKLTEGILLKKLIESIKDLVTDKQREYHYKQWIHHT